MCHRGHFDAATAGVQPLECRSCAAMCLLNPFQGTLERASLARPAAQWCVPTVPAWLGKPGWPVAHAHMSLLTTHAQPPTMWVIVDGADLHPIRRGPVLSPWRALIIFWPILSDIVTRLHIRTQLQKGLTLGGKAITMCITSLNSPFPGLSQSKRKDFPVSLQQTSFSRWCDAFLILDNQAQHFPHPRTQEGESATILGTSIVESAHSSSTVLRKSLNKAPHWRPAYPMEEWKHSVELLEACLLHWGLKQKCSLPFVGALDTSG